MGEINDWWFLINDFWSWEGFRFFLFQVISQCLLRRFLRQRDKSTDKNKKKWGKLTIDDIWFLIFEVFINKGCRDASCVSVTKARMIIETKKINDWWLFIVDFWSWERVQVFFVSGYRFVFAETLPASAWQKHWWK